GLQNIAAQSSAAITGVTNDTICTLGTVNLHATSSGGTINWYDSSTGGNLLASGTSYSPVIQVTTTFYVDAFGYISSGCSTPRTPVTGVVTASYGTGNISGNAVP